MSVPKNTSRDELSELLYATNYSSRVDISLNVKDNSVTPSGEKG